MILNFNIEGLDDEDIFAALRNVDEDDQAGGEEIAIGHVFKQAANVKVENEELDQNEWMHLHLLGERFKVHATQKMMFRFLNGHSSMSVGYNLGLEKGMEFRNGALFRAALREYCIREATDQKWVKNKGHEISTYCRNECGQRIYASVNKESNSLPCGRLMYQIQALNLMVIN